MTGVRRTQRGGASSAKALLRRGADDWLFVMGNDTRVITLIEQFDKVLDLAGITHNSHGDKYTLYSLRHFYAVLSLR
jgi:integrase